MLAVTWLVLAAPAPCVGGAERGRGAPDPVVAPAVGGPVVRKRVGVATGPLVDAATGDHVPTVVDVVAGNEVGTPPLEQWMPLLSASVMTSPTSRPREDLSRSMPASMALTTRSPPLANASRSPNSTPPCRG